MPNVARRPLLKSGVAAVVLIASVWGARIAFRIAWSDYRSHLSLPERQAAAESGTGNADLWLRVADLKRQMGQTYSRELERAIVCNPADSAPRILLALAYESNGDLARATDLLQQAAAIDHGFIPRWTLANFYLRRGDNALFFKWINQALSVGFGDLRPAFVLCWNISNKKQQILSAMPHRELVLRQYLYWLTMTQRFDAARDVSQFLSAASSENDRRVSPH